MFRYYRDMFPSLTDDFLYHFTSSESLLKIVENMTFKLSSFTLLNDLNESELSCEKSGGMDVIDIQNFIKEHCGLICFTQNYEQECHPFCQTGCNHPRMWAQYADNSHGACIVINEQQFIEKNKAFFEGKFYKIEDVAYSLTLYNKHIQTHNEPEKFIRDNWKHLFFHKYCDWKQEHERRLFVLDPSDFNFPVFLSIKGCIEFICLGRRFSNEDLQRLIHLMVTPGYESYLQLTPHDFAIQMNSNGTVRPHEYAGRILEAVKKSNTYTDNYLKYLKENGYANSDLC